MNCPFCGKEQLTYHECDLGLTELKPCPFCRGRAAYKRVGRENTVQCIDCPAIMSRLCDSPVPPEMYWNRRTDSERIAELEFDLGARIIRSARDYINKQREQTGKPYSLELAHYLLDGIDALTDHLLANFRIER